MASSRTLYLGLLLFGLSWLGYDHYRPWVNFHSEALACAGLLLLVASRLLDRGALPACPAIACWPLAAAASAWLWWVLGIGLFAGDALMASLYLAALAAALAVGMAWVRHPAPAVRERVLVGFAAAVAFAAIASAAIGLLQWLALTGPLGMYVVQGDPGDRAMGNLGQPNQLATLLLTGMAALLMLFEWRRVGRAVLALAIGFLTLVLVLTQSRSGMVGVLVAAVFLGWKAPQFPRLRRAAVLAWVAGFALATAVQPVVADALLLGGGRGAASLAHTGDRLSIWSQVAAGIAQAPWAGYGWLQTPTAQAAAAATVPGDLTYGFAHNVVLDLMAWNGIPLGLLWTGLVAWWLCVRLARASAPLAVAALAGLLPLAVHSLLEFPFAYAYFLVLAGLLAGIVEALHPGARAHPLRLRWAWPAFACAAVLGVAICREYLLVEEDFRVVRFENMRIGRTPDDYRVPEIRLLTHMGEMLAAARMRPAPQMAAQDLERLRRTALRFPFGSLHLRYAGALALNGDPAGAERQMRVIAGMFGASYHAAAQAELRALVERYAAEAPGGLH
ncbi:Wzy polymerase domain-containing protein [Pseudorhodoferax sp.]|uniref:PglL family O-oligosaccharyltransferase n=1 Tax=Pseudorhodoferax sp. TaxID=1993553 RepID=UPI0039E4A11C